MKILFISPDNNPFIGVGWGATQRTNLLLEACSMIGHCDVVSFIDGVESTNKNCDVICSFSLADNNLKEREGRVM